VIERITAIISQNGNMYEEGLGKKWEARKAYWKNPTPELRQQFSSAFALETIIGQYTFGTPEGSVGPDGYSLDYYYVNLPGRAEMQNDLILDLQGILTYRPSQRENQRWRSLSFRHGCCPQVHRRCRCMRRVLYPPSCLTIIPFSRFLLVS
jgi:hypothetical protein